MVILHCYVSSPEGIPMSNMIQHDQTSLMSQEVCTTGCLRKPSPARLSRRSLVPGVYQGRLGAGLCQGVLAQVSTLELPGKLTVCY